MTQAASAPETQARSLPVADLTALAGCGLIWGTTWFAITKQLGVVPTNVSVAYRFALSALLLFGWLAMRGKLKLSRAQHIAALGQGVCTFALDYPFIYVAEGHVSSAVVALIFASLAFLNLIAFRLVLGHKASAMAWGGAGLGVVGVMVLSIEQLLQAKMDASAVTGLVFAVLGVVTAAVGNLFAWRAQRLGANVAPSTAWAMAYGAAAMALFALVTGEPFRFDPRPEYVLSLLYLAVFGSVAAFMLYYGLARRRSYAFASYVSAITPPIALAMSVMFEHAHFGPAALLGLGLVLCGQLLLIRAPKT